MDKTTSEEEIAPRDQALEALEEFKQERLAREEERASGEQEKEKRKKVWVIGQWVILAICAAIIVYQAPTLVWMTQSDVKPVRQGTRNTDERTDLCIQNLWKASKLIQEGRISESTLVCPASNKPFEVIRTEDDIIVRSPSPELYGVREIRVSRKNPVPKVLQ